VQPSSRRPPSTLGLLQQQQQSTAHKPLPSSLTTCSQPPVPAADTLVDGLYTFYSDAQEITGKLTVLFLRQLQAHLDASSQNTTSRADLQRVIDEFKEVALDVLSYFRSQNSRALLLMLRQYARQGSFTVTDIDPDVLQQEVRQLLDLDELGRWYARVARKDHPSVTTWPFVGLQGDQVGRVEDLGLKGLGSRGQPQQGSWRRVGCLGPCFRCAVLDCQNAPLARPGALRLPCRHASRLPCAWPHYQHVFCGIACVPPSCISTHCKHVFVGQPMLPPSCIS